MTTAFLGFLWESSALPRRWSINHHLCIRLMWHLKRMQPQGFASSKSFSWFWKPLLKQAKSSSQVIFFQVIDETLSPTWDQLLLFSSVLVYGTRFCFLFWPTADTPLYGNWEKHSMFCSPALERLRCFTGKISRRHLRSQWLRFGIKTRCTVQ